MLFAAVPGEEGAITGGLDRHHDELDQSMVTTRDLRGLDAIFVGADRIVGGG